MQYYAFHMRITKIQQYNWYSALGKHQHVIFYNLVTFVGAYLVYLMGAYILCAERSIQGVGGINVQLITTIIIIATASILLQLTFILIEYMHVQTSYIKFGARLPKFGDLS